MTPLTLDLAEILRDRLRFGVSIPVAIDIDHLLESADDDWDHPLDLDALLADRRQAAVLLDATDVQRHYPHLTADQAWDLVQLVRADFEAFVDDAFADAVHLNHPTARMTLQTRLMTLRYRLNGRTDDAGLRLKHELAGLDRVFHKLPSVTEIDPKLEGSLTAALDDLEAAAAEGGRE